MVQYSFTSTETRRLVRTDSPGRTPRLSHSSGTMSLRSASAEFINCPASSIAHAFSLVDIIRRNSSARGFGVWLAYIFSLQKVKLLTVSLRTFWRVCREHVRKGCVFDVHLDPFLPLLRSAIPNSTGCDQKTRCRVSGLRLQRR